MDVLLRRGREIKAKVLAIINSPFDFSLEFKVLTFTFKLFGRFRMSKLISQQTKIFGAAFNPFDSSLLRTTSSKCRLAFLLGFLLFESAVSLSNVIVDFKDDISKQFSSMVSFFGALQVLFRQLFARTYKLIFEGFLSSSSKSFHW